MPEVTLYSSRFCFFCHRARQLLEAKQVAYREIDVSVDLARRREMIQRAGGRTSVPQIFIGDEHVGGCDDLHRLEASGQLDGRLRPG